MYSRTGSHSLRDSIDVMESGVGGHAKEGLTANMPCSKELSRRVQGRLPLWMPLSELLPLSYSALFSTGFNPSRDP